LELGNVVDGQFHARIPFGAERQRTENSVTTFERLLHKNTCAMPAAGMLFGFAWHAKSCWMKPVS
jgi:hypothetical protein